MSFSILRGGDALYIGFVRFLTAGIFDCVTRLAILKSSRNQRYICAINIRVGIILGTTVVLFIHFVLGIRLGFSNLASFTSTKF